MPFGGFLFGCAAFESESTPRAVGNRAVAEGTPEQMKAFKELKRRKELLKDWGAQLQHSVVSATGPVRGTSSQARVGGGRAGWGCEGVFVDPSPVFMAW